MTSCSEIRDRIARTGENAAASEELSAQAQLLKELIEKFQIDRNE